MKSYFTIIYIQPNSLTAEKYAVGLLAFNDQKVFFDYKVDKIDFIDKLYPSLNLKTGILNNLKSIKVELEKDKSSSTDLLFQSNNQLIDKAYTSYLHHYSKGLTQFSDINPIATELKYSIFQKLFEQFIIGDSTLKSSIKPQHKNFHQFFKKKINLVSLKDKMDIDLKLTPQKLNGIYSSTQVRMIGKNGVITAAQDIDFTINMESLGNQLSQWDVLVNALNTFSELKGFKKGDYHVYFNKPEPKSPQEKLLNNIIKQKSSLFSVDSVDEVDKLLAKIENNNYKPLSLFLS
jgi:hypothetical protein